MGKAQRPCLERSVEMLPSMNFACLTNCMQYKNPHLKAWNDLIKKYEANCSYLGEGARNMTQSVSYEM